MLHGGNNVHHIGPEGEKLGWFWAVGDYQAPLGPDEHPGSKAVPSGFCCLASFHVAGNGPDVDDIYAARSCSILIPGAIITRSFARNTPDRKASQALGQQPGG